MFLLWFWAGVGIQSEMLPGAGAMRFISLPCHTHAHLYACVCSPSECFICFCIITFVGVLAYMKFHFVVDCCGCRCGAR